MRDRKNDVIKKKKLHQAYLPFRFQNRSASRRISHSRAMINRAISVGKQIFSRPYESRSMVRDTNVQSSIPDQSNEYRVRKAIAMCRQLPNDAAAHNIRIDDYAHMHHSE